MAELSANNLTVSVGPKRLLEDVTIAFAPAKLAAIIGENGAGKSPLLRVLSGYQKLDAGQALLDGRDISAMRPVERARSIGWLPQALPSALPVTVRDAVALGRFAHGGTPHRLGEADTRAVDEALLACDLTEMADRSTTSLSGGELARMHLARALAAATPVMLVDEPLAALDPRHRLNTMEMLADLAVRQGRTIVVVLHDIGLAARFAHRIILMRQGKVMADGTPREVVTPAIIADGFGVELGVDNSVGWPQPVFLAPINSAAAESQTG